MRPIRLLAALVLVGILVSTATAAPKKYHFKLAGVSSKPEVKADVAKEATPRVEAQVKKTFETHKQLVAVLDGAPDPDAKAEAYRKHLRAKGLAGAYLVTVEITEASIELVPVESKPGTQRLVVRVAVHLLGENIPGRTMGFTGDGSATIKQEVGKKVRDRDREFTWDEAAKAAVDDAMLTVFKQLAVPPKKQ
jgi:hypothetical protein